MTPEEQLVQVEAAISSILAGGQSYKIGSRELTRADLKLLYSMQVDLKARIAAQNGSSLLDNTYVAVFGGR